MTDRRSLAGVTPVTFEDRRKVKSCLWSRRWNCLATSASMPGTIRSRNSTTGPLAPRLAQPAPSAGQRPGRGGYALLVNLDAVGASTVGTGGDDDPAGGAAGRLAIVAPHRN